MTSRLVVLVIQALLLTLLSGASAHAQQTQTPLQNPAERLFRYLENTTYIMPGRGIGNVVIGTPLTSVVQLWGTPLRGMRRGIFNRRTTLLYDAGIDAWVRVQGNRNVEHIGIEGRTGLSTTDGVRFGMPRHQVRTIYGKPEISQNETYRYPSRGISFVFRSGTVYQIEVFAPQEDS
jgi:hypothetical protein